jgi:hypothetical protein
VSGQPTPAVANVNPAHSARGAPRASTREQRAALGALFLLRRIAEVIGMAATPRKMFPGPKRPASDVEAVMVEAVSIDGTSEDLAERERRLIDAVVSLARSLRDERDRLAERLREVESQLGSLAQQLERHPPDTTQQA